MLAGEMVAFSQTQADKAKPTLSAEAVPGPALNVVPEWIRPSPRTWSWRIAARFRRKA